MRLLLFVSSHCPHCPEAEYVVKKVAPEYYDKGLLFRKIRAKTSEWKELSSRYRIMGTPTIILADDNWKETERIVGAPSESVLRDKIEKLLGLKKSFFKRVFGK